MVINGETIIFEGKKRYYLENLSKRDFNLENTAPHLLRINDYEIIENVWGEMIRSLCAYLLNIYPQYKTRTINFHTSWSKSEMFSSIPRTNFKQIDENLYINCNHTALHACWLIQDLLDLFEIDKSKIYFLIHRTPSSEPEKCREYFKNKFKNEFSMYLQLTLKKTEDTSSLIINNIEKVMDPILAKLSKSYDSFMLFEDELNFYNYSVKFNEYLENNRNISEKNVTIMKRYIDYLRKFYKV